MSEAIRVTATSPGTTDWRAEKADGTHLCDIRFELGARWYGSRYYVLRDGGLFKEGTFTFDVWDDEAARDVITAILRSMSPDADVTVEPRRPQRRAVA